MQYSLSILITSIGKSLDKTKYNNTYNYLTSD